MAYGLDECRMCGVRLKAMTATVREHYWAGIKEKPRWPEEKWRAAGFLASPNRFQLRNPSEGCCPDCAMKLAMQNIALGKRVTILLCILAAVLIAFFTFGTMID